MTKRECPDEQLIVKKAEPCDLSSDKIRALLSSLQARFDPSTLTITSINIPEALNRLVTVMSQMQSASYRVFELVERQKALCDQLIGLSDDLAIDAKSSGDLQRERVASFTFEHHRITQELRTLSHEVIIAHEFQDLSGQNVLKVKALLEWIDRDLRALLPQLGFTIPQSSTNPMDEPDLDQAATDEILGRGRH